MAVVSNICLVFLHIFSFAESSFIKNPLVHDYFHVIDKITPVIKSVLDSYIFL